jgi:hypothetical protein
MSDCTLPMAVPASRLFPGTGVYCLRRYPVYADEGEDQVAAASKVRMLLWPCHAPAFLPHGRGAQLLLLLAATEGQQGDAPAEWAEQERT